MLKFLGVVPPYMTFAGTIMAFLIPYLFFKINNKIHELGDPPWKKRNNSKS